MSEESKLKALREFVEQRHKHWKLSNPNALNSPVLGMEIEARNILTEIDRLMKEDEK